MRELTHWQGNAPGDSIRKLLEGSISLSCGNCIHRLKKPESSTDTLDELSKLPRVVSERGLITAQEIKILEKYSYTSVEHCGHKVKRTAGG